jgi:hypothetical protein
MYFFKKIPQRLQSVAACLMLLLKIKREEEDNDIDDDSHHDADEANDSRHLLPCCH